MTHTAYGKFLVSVSRIRKITCFLVYNHGYETFLLRIRSFFSYAVCVIRNGLNDATRRTNRFECRITTAGMKTLSQHEK